MEVEINYLGVLLGAVSSMVVGGIWYAKPVFGRQWMSLAGIDEVKAKAGAMKAMASMFVLSLVMSYVLAHVMYLSMSTLSYTYLKAGICSGFFMWIGFVFTTIVGTGLFEQRRKKLMLINAGNWLVTLVVMGAVIGFVGIE